MIGRRRLLLTATVVAVGGLLGIRPASASCAGPEVSINGRLATIYSERTPAPMSISRRTELVVTGRSFFVECDDMARNGGCSPVPPPDPSRPQTEVPLSLEQDDRSWLLATSDAAGAEDEWRITWRSFFPADCTTGPATLRVGPQLSIGIVLTA